MKSPPKKRSIRVRGTTLDLKKKYSNPEKSKKLQTVIFFLINLLGKKTL